MLNLDETPGRTASIGGKEYLFFSGYNYLGINEVPEFLSLIQQGLNKYGWLFPSSRISNTRLNIFEECETLLSEITGSEATVLLPSGFNAGRIATLVKEDQFFNAPGSHPAISRNKPAIQGFKEWSDWYINQLNSSTNTSSSFASDSVSPLTATIQDFSFLLLAKKNVTAIIDDSHGIGITGEEGCGVSSAVPDSANLEYIYTYSLSKAFGIIGGAVSCSKQMASILKTVPEFTAVTPPSPAQIYAFVKGQHLYSGQREKLARNINYFIACIQDIPGIHYHSGLPVFIMPEAFSEKLFFKHNIIISSFAYPDPSGSRLNRIVLNALHTLDDLNILSQCLRHLYAQNKEQLEV